MASLVFALVVAAHIGTAKAWERAYTAGSTDAKGNYVGGSELLHFVSHGGSLFSALGYWQDVRNCVYGTGSCLSGDSSWGQIIRLDAPDGQWVQELEMRTGIMDYFVRAEILTSLTFTTDASGGALSAPITLLVAGAGFGGSGSRIGAKVWIRNDGAATWQSENLLGGQACRSSVRALAVHRDSVTGVDRAFVTVGTCGVLSGTLSANSQGIDWASAAEPGTSFEVRGLALTDANGQLHVSAGEEIYRRTDGASPTWSLVFETGFFKASGALGGIRGMTAIDNPGASGESLLFMWAVAGDNRGCMVRLDPDGSGGYDRVEESCLAESISEYLGGASVYMTIGAYNSALAVVDPADGSTVHLIGFQAQISCSGFPCVQRDAIANSPAGSGFYSGGIFFVRRSPGEYTINEVAGPIDYDRPALVATRAYVLSPFAADQIYFGGYDCNVVLAPTETAWAYRSSITEALETLSPQSPSPNPNPSPSPSPSSKPGTREEEKDVSSAWRVGRAASLLLSTCVAVAQLNS